MGIEEVYDKLGLEGDGRTADAALVEVFHVLVMLEERLRKVEGHALSLGQRDGEPEDGCENGEEHRIIFHPERVAPGQWASVFRMLRDITGCGLHEVRRTFGVAHPVLLLKGDDQPCMMHMLQKLAELPEEMMVLFTIHEPGR